MATLNWTYKKEVRSVDINKLDFIQTDDFFPDWNVCCGAVIYDVDISQRLFVRDGDNCRKKIFTYDFETGEFKDLLIFVSDVDFFEYDKSEGSVVIALKKGGGIAIDPVLYSIDFKKDGIELL